MKKNFIAFLVILFCTSPLTYGSASLSLSKIQTANIAPTLTAVGNQIYCPGTSMKIVTDMTITDPDDTGIDAIYIQISSGYDLGNDALTLTGTHPNINAGWNATTGTLTLTGITGQPTYIELVAAIKDIEFTSGAANPSGTRNFSITIGQANYLPSNGHYYLYIPNLGITWSSAKIAAQNSTYYGLQGYLATITSAEEAQISGEQTTGAGWIGGSDEETEGIWKWMTGPEIGTVFWNGTATGFTNNYAFWNSGEPNNAGNEDYAHITAPGVGIPGSWNDLSNTGDTSGNYQPKGYIVEYGGTPGDPTLNIATSTTLTVASITSSTSASRCGTGSVTLQAVSNTGTVNWYSVPTGGTPIGTGNSFATPDIASTTLFYAAAHSGGCPDTSRIPVTASVTPKPVLTVSSPYFMCDGSNTTINLVTTSGIIYWYDSPTSTSPIFTGTQFAVPNIHQDTFFYAEANNNGCLSDRETVEIQVYASPVVTDEVIELCEGDTAVLSAGNPNMTYLWSTGETTQTIVSNGLTDYSVVVTTPAPESCSKTKNFSITYHAQPVISSIETNGLEVTINTTQSGDFEYSLDGIVYQNSNVFTVSEGGMYIGYVRERNQCGFDQKTFIVISVPAFFTPNGDNINDTWSIKGANFFPNAEVLIFDRFGKMIAVLNHYNPFWDGTYNGNLLPSTDYWFVAKINDSTPEIKGHFAMLR
ncbi:T9SS type B sorting domain-containing protein [Flavobacterium sp. J49]|uniref:T9SS type B sorting domain-containing protein n=1 Tax=Flavobacterium sp. J49 TaxID=2718534 RepID=UPI001592D197|nr:T9SS type B sorting domain-containing protein [Flavobacterium sp. J49]MBF6640647.1 T9SS type B sorting domain-containing protein [Flavobacterium sp. J49]NIC01894.1 T9SS type B sorting domain-containing protein [Flavobacterium sp. J49]